MTEYELNEFEALSQRKNRTLAEDIRLVALRKKANAECEKIDENNAMLRAEAAMNP